jgi:gephyrin
VSALVTFYLFVLPALRKMSGHPSPNLTQIKVKVSLSASNPQKQLHIPFKGRIQGVFS